MKKTTLKKITILCTTLFATAVFAHTLITSAVYAPDTQIDASALSPRIASATTTRALPERLSIPSLGIAAAIEHVGVNYKGNMASPSDYDDVAWYMHGTVPGEKGSAVMAGHKNDGLGLSGVFEELDSIALGDAVVVTGADGTEATFVVERIEEYDYKSVPLDEVFASEDAARLNLITCAGRWTWDGNTYDKRVVVFAKLVQ